MVWKGIERRNHQDIWLVIFKWLSIISWLLFLFALVVSFYAAPEKSYGLLRYHGIEVRKFWQVPLTGYLYIILWVSALFSYASIIINHFRSRRATDNKQYNLTLLLIITVTWVIYIIFNF